MTKTNSSSLTPRTSNGDIAISVKGVSKSFKLPHEKSSSLKSSLVNFKKRGYENQHVLKNISFEVKKGEFFGIVGRNGSGKSTLLKLIAGVYTPDKGSITVNGTLTPFIELGVGFNPELTGRENVYLNGALMGFNRKEMDVMYDEIVEFAELERFMDQKLKNYSSGMQVRLAFSIAIQARNDVLVLDEVLAVGDANFQQKCNDFFEQQKAKGQTIILVTHDMASVERYCTRALMLKDGEVVHIGSPEKVATEYSEENQKKREKQVEQEEKLSNQKIRSDGVDFEIINERGRKSAMFSVGDKVGLRLRWDMPLVKNVGIALIKQSGERIFAANTIIDEVTVDKNICTYWAKLMIAPGRYHFRIRLMGKDEKETVSLVEKGPSIIVRKSDKYNADGLVYLEHNWS